MVASGLPGERRSSSSATRRGPQTRRSDRQSLRTQRRKLCGALDIRPAAREPARAGAVKTPEENGKEPMIGDRLDRPTFAVVHGYDRTHLSRVRETLNVLVLCGARAG